MVTRFFVFCCFVFCTSIGWAQMPNTDIYLLDFEYLDGQISFGQPKNITNHDGYDNQPYFMPTKEGVLFSSDRGGDKTDIYHFYFRDGKTYNLTKSPDRAEYSPRFTPDGKHFSVVMVEEDDSTQRLWQYQNPGENPEVIWRDNKKVGYYSWIDADKLAAFVLGDSNTLHIYDRSTNEDQMVCGQIGRCLLPVPKMPGQVSYVSKRDSTNWTIRRYNPADSTDYFIANCIPGNEDFAWLADGSLLMSANGKIYYLHPGKDAGWKEVADFSKSIGNFYRLVVNNLMTQIAVVGYQGEKP